MRKNLLLHLYDLLSIKLKMGYCLPSYILMQFCLTFWNVSNGNKHVIHIERRFENLSERTMLCSHVSMTNWPCLPKRQHHWSAIIGFSCVDGYVLLNTNVAIWIWFSGYNIFCILVIIFSSIRNTIVLSSIGFQQSVFFL